MRLRLVLLALFALAILAADAAAWGRYGRHNGPVRQFFRGGPGGSCPSGQASGCASCSQPATYAAATSCACGPNCPCAAAPQATAPGVGPLDYAALYALVARGGFGEVYVGTNPTTAPTAPYSVVPAGYGGLAAGVYDVRFDSVPRVYQRAGQQPQPVRYVWQCGPNGCQRVTVAGP